MAKPLELAFLAGGGLGLFSLCFVGFAAMAGVPMHTLPVVGSFFEEPEPVEDPLEDLATDEPVDPASEVLYPDKPTKDEEREILGASLGVIGSFAVQAPFDREELAALVEELEQRRTELDERYAELEKREEGIEAQVLFLQERSSELERVRESIEARHLELAEELARIETAREELERERAEADLSSEEKLARKAELFAEGEPELAAQRLVPMGAEQAGKLLRRLDPERARGILDALPAENWAEFAEAYTSGS